ncbi:MAG: hypothetical protein K2X27_22220 [Candidatus Obscuribacterales bacterium]|nr:hypothetical protein [Candidatus Obscuribacterales bacterium]
MIGNCQFPFVSMINETHPEVYRLTDRKHEAKEALDQALGLVAMLQAEKCPLCEESNQSIPMIYAPHSEELAEWVKGKSAELGDFKELTSAKRKCRAIWYCTKCETGY